MSEQPPYIEKYVTFTLSPTGVWDVQMWSGDASPLSGKVYRLKIPVPAELIPIEIQATIEPVSE